MFWASSSMSSSSAIEGDVGCLSSCIDFEGDVEVRGTGLGPTDSREPAIDCRELGVDFGAVDLVLEPIEGLAA